MTAVAPIQRWCLHCGRDLGVTKKRFCNHLHANSYAEYKRIKIRAIRTGYDALSKLDYADGIGEIEAAK